ncbi:DUF4440 domain-containing protein [Amycolatopsis sp. 195334CR]|nr:DUF4440 domain-containing protein [Amycolatopsis sp. 195334CR]
MHASDAVGEQLRGHEPLFHRAELGTSREDFEQMMAPDYWEVGASGAKYGRDRILSELDQRYSTDGYAESDTWEVHDFACRALGEATFLVTYELLHRGRRTRRATVWARRPSGWQAQYHQGTVIPD